MGQKGHPERAWAVAPPCRWPSAWILHGRELRNPRVRAWSQAQFPTTQCKRPWR